MTLPDLKTALKKALLLTAALFAGLLSLTPAAEAQDYNINPGDVLRIEVIEDPSLNRSVLVPPDGKIVVPLAGSVQAGGRGVDQVQSDLAALLAPNFAASPSVFVSIEQIAQAPAAAAAAAAPTPINIFVLGQAANPGRLAIAPGTTVLQLFAEMGGFSPFAATKRIQLRRADSTGTEQVYLINYDAIEAGASKNGATVLREGDVIVVPQRRLFE
jgi:polysaccharide export outer membrane protein